MICVSNLVFGLLLQQAGPTKSSKYSFIPLYMHLVVVFPISTHIPFQSWMPCVYVHVSSLDRAGSRVQAPARG